jgi:hypothetical protein
MAGIFPTLRFPCSNCSCEIHHFSGVTIHHFFSLLWKTLQQIHTHGKEFFSLNTILISLYSLNFGYSFSIRDSQPLEALRYLFQPHRVLTPNLLPFGARSQVEIV